MWLCLWLARPSELQKDLCLQVAFTVDCIVTVYVTVDATVLVDCGAASIENSLWYANGLPLPLLPRTRIRYSPEVIWLLRIGHVDIMASSSGTVATWVQSYSSPLASLTNMMSALSLLHPSNLVTQVKLWFEFVLMK